MRASLLTTRDRCWGDKTYLGIDYYFLGYFAEIVGKLDVVAARYEAAERKGDPALRRRHAEREHLRYAAARNAAVRAVVPGPDGGGQSGWRRPFVAHCTGCNPCGSKRNAIYTREICEDGMRRELGFADDQVLRAYGFHHATPLNDSVRPPPFNYPAARAQPLTASGEMELAADLYAKV
ncbi:unnamed protein product [Miscanthus lutarioriparius]|uniref:Uncharacterized protein n=1 Tax=Miscanthus lutarioriparius TaxID=422564 RepID=A0A811Q602_9POAL|nr:unnamed protein product [Miscanthus lutarioriparius]